MLIMSNFKSLHRVKSISRLKIQFIKETLDCVKQFYKTNKLEIGNFLLHFWSGLFAV